MTKPVDSQPHSPTQLSRRVGVGMLWSQGSKIVEVGLTFGTAILVVRGLNPGGFGAYSLLTNLAGVASVFVPIVTTESLGAVLPRFVTAGERVFVVAAVALARTATILVASLLALVLWGQLTGAFGLDGIDRRIALLGIGYWLAQDLLNTVSGYFAADLDMKPVALWRIAGIGGSFVVVAVLALLNTFSVGRVLAAVGAGYLVALLGLGYELLRRGRPHTPPREQLRGAFGLTRHTWLIGVLGFTLATQIDVLLIGVLTGTRAEAGFYAAAVGVVGRAQLLVVSGWSTLIIPTFAHAFNTGGAARLGRAWRRSAQLWLLISLPLNALLLANASVVVGVLFGSPYLAAARLLETICVFNIVAALFVNPACIGAIWVADRQRALTPYRAGSAALNLVLALILIPTHGALGAAIATGVATVAGGAAEYWLSRRQGVHDYPFRVAAHTGVAAAAAMIPGFAIGATSALGLLAAGALGMLLYVGVLTVLKPFDRDELAAAIALHRGFGLLARRSGA